MGVHLYTNGAWTDSGRIYRNSLNLFNMSNYSSYTTGITDIVVTSDSITYTASSIYLAIRYFIPLDTTDIFTLKLGANSLNVRFELRYRKNGESVGDLLILTAGNSYTIHGSENVDEIQINISNSTNTGTCIASNIMLNTGETALSFEPFNVVDWYTNHGHNYSSGAWS